jgi:hypothetical protein
LISGLLPQVGMEFNTIQEAWMFWVTFGGQKALRLEKNMQTKGNLMKKLDLADMFVQMKVIECQIKGITSQSVQELKLELIVQSA